MNAAPSPESAMRRTSRARALTACLIASSLAGTWGLVQASRSDTTRSPGGAREPEINAPGLVWDDEFSGPAGSRPSPARWEIEYGSRDGMLQEYTGRPSNVSLDGAGHLVIIAQRTAAGGYTSASIQTEGRFQTEYGRLEARIKLPGGQGLWPAFWAVGSDFNRVGWPRSGEIDMMENFGNDPFKITGSIHGPWGPPHDYAVQSDKLSSVSLANAFHVYGVIWRPDRIAFTLDGTGYATVTPASLSPGQQWVFNKPFFLILDLAVGGQSSGSPVATPFPARMLVDWVRVYRLGR
jgi:beta-glucanase (GH16 family)